MPPSPLGPGAGAEASADEAPFVITPAAPAAEAGCGLVVASPHSGDHYPEDLRSATRLGPLMLRASEDCFVDRIFAAAPRLGAALLAARFPRAYVDVNREPYEFDPLLFDAAPPSYARRDTVRVSAGLGTLARVVANGADIYRRKLDLEEAERRIEGFYWPYHRALAGLLKAAQRRAGFALLIDAHSMPSASAPLLGGDALPRRLAGRRQRSSGAADIVLGDQHGRSCAPEVAETAQRVLTDLGYRVARNRPFAGGFVTRHYGRPELGRHVLQVEINRGIYMDERRLKPRPELEALARDMARLMAALAALPLGDAA